MHFKVQSYTIAGETSRARVDSSRDVESSTDVEEVRLNLLNRMSVLRWKQQGLHRVFRINCLELEKVEDASRRSPLDLWKRSAVVVSEGATLFSVSEINAMVVMVSVRMLRLQVRR